LQVTSLQEVLQKKNKSVLARPGQIKNNITIFVNSLIENPTFDSQTKENMTLKVSAFGSKASVSDDFHKKSKLLSPSFFFLNFLGLLHSPPFVHSWSHPLLSLYSGQDWNH